jgi:hypothetical protein
MITYRTITVKELPDFIRSRFFAQLPEIPITPHRALSLAANPRAQADDPALLLALGENENLLGYWGFLSDFAEGDPAKKTYWNSGWRMLPGASHAAMPLLYKALQLCNGNIFFSDLTPHTHKILTATGKVTIMERQGVRWYFKSRLTAIIPAKKPALRFMAPLFFVTDAAINLFVRPKTHKLPDGITIEECRPGENDKLFIDSFSKPSLSARNIAELKWILENPWVINTQDDNPDIRNRYYFTSSATNFRARYFRIHQNDETIALALINHRNGHATLPFYLCHPGKEKTASEAMTHIISMMKPVSFTTFHQQLNSGLPLKALHKKTTIRYFAWGSKTPVPDPAHLLIQDGDGDCAFT